jgi:hypothetical protein
MMERTPDMSGRREKFARLVTIAVARDASTRLQHGLRTSFQETIGLAEHLLQQVKEPPGANPSRGDPQLGQARPGDDRSLI